MYEITNSTADEVLNSVEKAEGTMPTVPRQFLSGCFEGITSGF